MIADALSGPPRHVVVTLASVPDPTTRWPGTPESQGHCLAAALRLAGCKVDVVEGNAEPPSSCEIEISFHPEGLHCVPDADLRVVAQVHDGIVRGEEPGLVHEVCAPERLLYLPAAKCYLAQPAPQVGPLPSIEAMQPAVSILLRSGERQLVAFAAQLAARLVDGYPLLCVAPGRIAVRDRDGLRDLGTASAMLGLSMVARSVALIHLDLLTGRGLFSSAGPLAQLYGVPVLAQVDRTGTQAAAMIEDGQTGFLRVDLGDLRAIVPSLLRLDRQRVATRASRRLGPVAAARSRLATWTCYLEGGA